MRRWLRDLLPHFGPVWKLSLPVILANSLQSLTNVTNIFFAGRLGPVEIAAIGMSNSVNMLLLVAFMSITAASMALAAQAKGARDEEALSTVAHQSISLGVIMWLVLGSLGMLFAQPILGFLNSGGDPAAVEMGTVYLQVMFAGIIFMVLNLTISSLMQGAGDTVTPLWIAVFMNVINVFLNYALMFGLGPIPALGVTGAAIGTVLSRAIAAGIGIWVMYSGRNIVKLGGASYRPNLQAFREILAIGIPSGLQGIVRNTSQLLVIRIVTATAAGTLGASALAVGLQVESLAFMPGLAISIAATSVVGQALGAWQKDDARHRGNAAIVLGVVVMSVIAVPLVIWAPQVMRLFDPTANEVLLNAGTSYIRINGVVLPFLAYAMIGNGALRGAGDTTPGMWGAILSRWIIVVPVSWLLALQLGMGVDGVWWALAAGTVFQAVFVLWNWQSSRWLRISLEKSRLFRLHLSRIPLERAHHFLDNFKTPLMAAGASEKVTGEGATYRTSTGSVYMTVESSDYRISDPSGVLGRPDQDGAPATGSSEAA